VDSLTLPTADEIQAFILRAFPNPDEKPGVIIEHAVGQQARVRMPTRPEYLRPGQSVSGPAQMALADTVAWVHVLANLGFEAAASVTSQLNINFLSRPGPVDLIGEGVLLKLGKSLSVSEVRLYSEGRTEPVAFATVTYAVRRMSQAG
jgi:uncharacterized protein (TIGR00369 family)